MTPEKVIEGMSFAEQSEAFSARYAPLVPPPAAPPPSPPGSSSSLGSYQKQQINYSRKGSRTEIPTVTNYSLTEEEQNLIQSRASRSASNNESSSSGLRGDASLRPNTGFSNASDEQGEALLEVLWKMRLMNIGGCIAAMLLGLPDFFRHVFALQPARLVLNIYRLFFCLVLGCYEFHTPYIRDVVIDNFGLIHHPFGRTMFLLLLSGLCVSQGTILDILIGAMFVVTAFMTFYAYVKYPEYRRLVDQQPNLAAMARRRIVERGSRFSWAQPEMITSIARASAVVVQEEDNGGEERKSLMASFRV